MSHYDRNCSCIDCAHERGRRLDTYTALEAERDTARHEVKLYQETHIEDTATIAELTAERDQLRKELDETATAHTESINKGLELRAERDQLKAEHAYLNHLVNQWAKIEPDKAAVVERDRLRAVVDANPDWQQTACENIEITKLTAERDRYKAALEEIRDNHFCSNGSDTLYCADIDGKDYCPRCLAMRVLAIE